MPTWNHYRKLEARRGDFRGFGNTSEEFARNLEEHALLARTDEEQYHAVVQVSYFLACRTISSAHGDRIYAALLAAGNPYAPAPRA